MNQMLKYEDCGLKNIWLANGFRYEDLEGVGRCLEIDDIDGLHRAIGHRLVNYKKRLTGRRNPLSSRRNGNVSEAIGR
jgi:hypothetical protein